jgi:hypothetical protein
MCIDTNDSFQLMVSIGWLNIDFLNFLVIGNAWSLSKLLIKLKYAVSKFSVEFVELMNF